MTVKELIIKLLEMPMDAKVNAMTVDKTTTNVAFEVNGIEQNDDDVFLTFSDWRNI